MTTTSATGPHDVGSLPVIAVVSSPLQYAVFVGSRYAMRNVRIIGSRGIAGDLSYQRSVLNNHQFLADLDAIIGPGKVEVFLPNALNGLFFFCVTHPGVERISFVDEGRLTKRFLAEGFTKQTAPLSYLLVGGYRIARILPKIVRSFVYRALAAFLQRVVIRTYERDTIAYPYRTIERRWKSGVVLSHICHETETKNVEFVDLTKDLDLPMDCNGAACLFVHPKDVATPDKIGRIRDRIAKESAAYDRGLLRPHPLFSHAPQKLQEIRQMLAETGRPWEFVTLSGRYETTIELYARGVRLFIVGNSSLMDTVTAYPNFFSELRMVEI